MLIEHRSHVLLAGLIGLVLRVALAAPIVAQLPKIPGTTQAEAKPEEAESVPSEAGILKRREQLQSTLDELRRRQESASSADRVRQIEKLEQIDSLLTLQQAELRRAGETLENPLPSSLEIRFGHAPPYSIAELDLLLDDFETVSASQQVGEEARREATRLVESAASRLDDLERRRRLADDQTPHPAGAPGELDLEVEEATQRLRLRRLQLRGTELQFEFHKACEEQLQAQVRELRSELQLKPADLASAVAAFGDRAASLDEQLNAVRQRSMDAESRSSALLEKVEMTRVPGARLLAQGETLQLQLAAERTEEILLEKRRDRLGLLESSWRLRYRVLGGTATVEELARSDKELTGLQDDLESESRLVEARLGEQRLSLSIVHERQANPSVDPDIRRWLSQQEDHLKRIVALYEGEIEDLGLVIRLTRRLLSEIADRRGGAGAGERLALFRSKLVGLWSYEITTVDDEPITIGKIAVALLLILVGYVISKLLSRRLGRLIGPRLGLTKGAAVAIQTLAFYGLLAIFFLWALQVVKIPLTVFTVVGGVLAIGLGFGSQTIMNNFISGLIILVEQPIKAGDLIDVDGIFGQVERIGPRSSRIRAGDNTHVIVPNSAFLEKNVLNWTMSDDVIRISVDVGVAYGSPVEEVRKCLQRALDEEPGILPEPEPEILFMDFGDNALAFRAYFWVRITRSLDRYRFQSRLRFRIDAIFAEAGIVIAFPQRDVHLNTSSPLEVRLVSEPGAVGKKA